VSVSAGPTLRAPAADGAVVAEPPLSTGGDLLTINRQRLRQPGPLLLGRPLSELRLLARQEAAAAARGYFDSHGEPIPESNTANLIVAGHQPELFHPGVWVKHFALNGLARAHGVTPLNLIVDNDTVKSTVLRLPSPPDDTHPLPHSVSLPFDRWPGEIPYEEYRIQDAPLFVDFANRAIAVLGGWGYETLLPAFWDEVRRQAEQRPLLGDCFAAARRSWERRWGCHNLEVPVSSLCRGGPYAWFACHLLSELPRFHGVYNACVRAYRLAHGIRSRNHPVPDLVEKDGWFELPFWAWRAGQTRRGRLFARLVADRVELRAGDEPWPELPLASANRPREAIEAWQSLELRGCKVRSRALTNTLYARLFLADLFVHGIGGGKYDELTDEIIRRFYGIEPPAFLVLSATRLLPLPVAPVSREDRQRLARRVRDLEWNPQRHLELTQRAALGAVIDEKQAWVAREPADAAGRRQRYETLRSLTSRLREPLRVRQRRLREELARCDKQLEANAVLRRRDYSFCIYPEDTLREFCTQFL
jgi:hypothetical protein